MATTTDIGKALARAHARAEPVFVPHAGGQDGVPHQAGQAHAVPGGAHVVPGPPHARPLGVPHGADPSPGRAHGVALACPHGAHAAHHVWAHLKPHRVPAHAVARGAVQVPHQAATTGIDQCSLL